jgi:hypothetical protein
MKGARLAVALAMTSALAVASVRPAFAQAQGYEPYPLDPGRGFSAFSIPRAPKPPTLDGKLAPGEWDRAVLLNVMGDQQARPAWAFLYARWVKWRMMWDDDNLYLCSESQRLPNEDLSVNNRDQSLGGNTVMDDSIEVHFSPVGRNAVGKNLPWAAQAIINPLGVGYYTRFTWAVAARTSAWVPDWPMGSEIHKDAWVIEIAIPRASMDLTQPNRAGDAWSILLARNWKVTGWNQSAIPAPLTSFQVPQEHPFAWLTDGAYARLEDVSGFFKGDIHADLVLGTCGDKPVKVAVKMLVEEVGKTEGEPLKWEKEETVDVAPGKAAALTVREAGRLKDGTYRCFMDVTSADSKHPLLRVNFLARPGSDAALAEKARGLKSRPYTFMAQLAPTVSKLVVFADYLNSPRRDDVRSLRVRLAAADAQKPLFEGASSNAHYYSIRETFQLPALAPGKYAWAMALLDAGGQTVAEQTGEIEKKDEAAEFPWWNFAGGRIDRVLPPYEPVKAEDGGARLRYWGGEVYLNGLCLPRQMRVTANSEWRPPLLEDRPSVLARPVEVRAAIGGRPARLDAQAFPRTTDVKDHIVSMRGYGLIGDSVEAQADATFEQDGLLWVTLTLRPSRDSSSGRDVRRKQAALDSLSIDIPLRAEVARSIVAHGAPGYGSFTIGPVPQGAGVVWNCTDVGRSVLVYGDLLPLVWLGNDHRGLCFFAENNRGWAHKDKPDQQVLRAPGEVVLRLNVIQEPITIEGERSFSFGFMPTPMRPMTPGWRMLNCSFSQNFADSFQTGRNMSREQYYNASFSPESYDKSRIIMFRNTQNIITTLGGFEFAPHTERGGYESVSRDWAARGYFGPEWDQNTWTPAFQNHLLWQLQRWMDEGGLTGIYHDQFCPHPVTNAISGAAWTLPDGRVNRGYNMRLDRAYSMREYALFAENGIEPRIFCHTTNGGPLICYPWVTAVLDGEANMVIANADYDFVDIYPPERMQAYGGPWNWGNTFYWMRLIQEGEAKWRKAQDRAYQGWTILHDVMYANGAESHRAPFFDWGMNDRRVKYWPYWRSGGIVRASDPDVLVSMWTLPDRALLCAFNMKKKEPTAVEIHLPLEDMGLLPNVRSEYIRGYDLEGGEAAFDAWAGTFKATIAPHDFRLLVVRRYAD